MQSRNDLLFEETRITLNNAIDRNAQIFELDNLSESAEYYKSAVEILKQKGSSSYISEELEKSIALLTNINEDVDKKNEFFKNVLTSRRNALILNADIYSQYYWLLAEEGFLDAIEEYNDDNYDEIPAITNEVINNYSKAVLNSQKTANLLFKWKPIQKADSALAYLLSPETYNQGLEYYYSAIEGLSTYEEINVINSNISEAGKNFIAAVQTANEFSKNHPRVIQERKNAQTAGAETYAATEWQEAEDLLNEAGIEFENKEYESVYKYAAEAEEKYKISKQAAVKEKYLFIPRKKLELAADDDVDYYAPITFSEAQKLYFEAYSLIESNHYTEPEVELLANLCEQEIDKANWITSVIKSEEDGETTWEKIILGWNIWESFNKSKKIQDTQRNYNLISKPVVKEIKSENTLSKYRDLIGNIPDLDMEILEQGDNILMRIYNINFRPAGSNLNDVNKALLDKLIPTLEKFNNSVFQVCSFTDNVGAQRTNIEISEARANAISDYLTKNSLQLSGYMSSVGYGEVNPISSNEDIEGRKRNNRIEIVISEK